MIRNPIKLGVLQAEANGNRPLEIEVGHGGTISQFLFRCRNGSSAATQAAILAALNTIPLDETQVNEGNFAPLNKVTPKFLNFREQLHYQALGIVNEDGMLSYDPAAGTGKDELRRDQLTLGTQDLISMTLTPEWAGSVTGITHIEVYADIDYNLVQPLGEHVRIGRLTDSVSATGGEVEMTEFPKMDARYGYNAIHIEELIDDGDDLTVDEVTIVINGTQFPFRDVPADVIERLQKYGYRRPQAGFFTLDFNKEDVHQYFLPAGMNELKIVPSFEVTGTPTGGNFPAWYELIKKA